MAEFDSMSEGYTSVRVLRAGMGVESGDSRLHCHPCGRQPARIQTFLVSGLKTRNKTPLGPRDASRRKDDTYVVGRW